MKTQLQKCLAALEDLCECCKIVGGIALPAEIDSTIELLREVVKEPDAEPAAWLCVREGGINVPFIYSVEQLEQLGYGNISVPPFRKIAPLYRAAAKPWVGLTDNEIKEIIGSWGDTPIKGYTRKLMDQIQDKLKEKNT